MPTVARLTQSGDFLLKGEVNELLPPVQRNLVAHLPLQEDTTAHKADSNILSTKDWVLGASDAPGYQRNGTATENQILMHENPWGEMDLVWGCINNDVDSNADGGWNGASFPVDPTKTYRFSVWVKVTREGGDGGIYLGTGGSTVANFADGSTNTNPYFVSSDRNLPDGEWVLITGYVFPHDATGIPTLSYGPGIYKTDGTFIRSTTSYKWLPTTTASMHRAFLYYSTTPQIRVYFYRPRVDVMDGYEPSTTNLLNGITRINNGMTVQHTNPLFGDGGAWIGKRPVQLSTPIEQYNIYNNFAQPATITKLEETYNGYPIYRVGFTVTDAARLSDFQTNFNNHGVKSGAAYTFKANTPYTYSMIWRPVNKELTVGWAPSNVGGWELLKSRVIPLDNGWYKHMVTRSETYATEVKDQLYTGMKCPTLALNEVVYFDFTCPSLFEGENEEMYAINEARPTTETSSLRITPAKKLTPPFSINFFYKESVRVSTMVDTGQANYPVIMQLNNYYTNPSLTLWDMNRQIICLNKGDTGTGWASLNNGSGTGVIVDDAYQASEHMYTVLFRSPTQMEVYIDGVLKSRNTTSPGSSAFDFILFYETGASRKELVARVRDVSIYDDALSESEIARLFSTRKGMQLTATGNVNSALNESSAVMAPKRPMDYIPMTEDSLTGVNQLISPSKANFAMTTPMGTFVPRSANSLLTPSNLTPFNSEKFGKPGWEVHGVRTDRPLGAGDDRVYITTTNIPLSPSTIYSFQLTYWSSNGVIDDIYLQFTGSGYPEGGIYYRPFASESNHATFGISRTIEPLGNNLYRLKATFRTTADTSKLVCIFFDSDLTGISTFATEPEFTLGQYIEYGSNGVGALEFNLTNSLDWDWSKNWTIAYWKRPIGTVDANDFRGYCLDSIGCNSNSVGGGYLWWGKTTGSASDTQSRLCLGEPAVQSTNVPYGQYFDKWHLIVLSCVGGNMSVTFLSRDFGEVTFTRTLTGLTKNAMLTQYGYDLKLGGYDNGQQTSAWYKDVMFFKEALSIDDTRLLFNRGMKHKNTNKTEVVLKGQVRENTPL